ncbi:LOW QUALITY PROTEIN: hypothetical protein Cgig2_009911 [Carnegiea gigantea]|uniref:Uncharacterized protein n=1 Tax=Carnegiea gigantea TaxID=171969 RepID=A0A9Q1K358_9CARY|nr:LOW QUALITY PROTEIN: hypothetical protein Cgig2_009911 [Carnegiea gigantea]
MRFVRTLFAVILVPISVMERSDSWWVVQRKMMEKRSGRSSINEAWADEVDWRQGNLFHPETIKDALDGVTSVVSCVGGFGSSSYMYKINGTANINAIGASAEKGYRFTFRYRAHMDFKPPLEKSMGKGEKDRKPHFGKGKKNEEMGDTKEESHNKDSTKGKSFLEEYPNKKSCQYK